MEATQQMGYTDTSKKSSRHNPVWRLRKMFRKQGLIQIIEATDDKIFVATDQYGKTFTTYDKIYCQRIPFAKAMINKYKGKIINFMFDENTGKQPKN